MAVERSSAGKHRRGRAPFAVKTLASLDQRSHAARFTFSLMSSLLRDAAGGVDLASTAQRELAKHAALLGLSLEDASVKLLEGKADQVNLDRFMAMANCQRRCLEALGLERQARDVTPTPLQYARQRAAENAEAA